MAGDRRILVGIRHLHRNRAVREEDVVAPPEGHAIHLPDQARGEPSAINEQIPGDAAAVGQVERSDVAIVGHHYVRHVTDDMLDAKPTDGVLAQQRREFARIEMISVIGDPAIFGRGDRLRGKTGVAQRLLEIDPVGEITVR